MSPLSQLATQEGSRGRRQGLGIAWGRVRAPEKGGKGKEGGGGKSLKGKV